MNKTKIDKINKSLNETGDKIAKQAMQDILAWGGTNLLEKHLPAKYSAAPDLLKALKNLVKRCDGPEGVQSDGSNMCTLEAHAAIKKAEGL